MNEITIPTIGYNMKGCIYSYQFIPEYFYWQRIFSDKFYQKIQTDYIMLTEVLPQQIILAKNK